MSTEFNFLVMDANQRVEAQQGIVRQIVSQRIDLARFKRKSFLPLPPSTPPDKKLMESDDEDPGV